MKKLPTFSKPKFCITMASLCLTNSECLKPDLYFFLICDLLGTPPHTPLLFFLLPGFSPSPLLSQVLVYFYVHLFILTVCSLLLFHSGVKRQEVRFHKQYFGSLYKRSGTKQETNTIDKIDHSTVLLEFYHHHSIGSSSP